MTAALSGWDELGEGIFRRRYPSLDLNIGLVVGETGALIVDTRASLAQARQLREDLAQVTSAPLRWVVNTHWHWDHTFGNEIFTAATIWAHEECRRVLFQRGDEAKAEAATVLDPAEGVAEVTVRLPDTTFELAERIDLGGRHVDLRFLGRGHTEGDIVIWADDVRFAGDLLEEGSAPWFGDGYPISWPGTVDRLLETGGRIFVPGHGDVMSPAMATDQLEDLRAVADLARESFRVATPVESIDVGSTPFPEATMREALARAYRELTEQLSPGE